MMWIATTMVQLQHLGVLSLGAASGALYMQTITDLDKMHLVKRHVAAVDVIIVAELIRGVGFQICSHGCCLGLPAHDFGGNLNDVAAS